MKRLCNPFEDFVDQVSGQLIRNGINKVSGIHCDRLQAEIDRRKAETDEKCSSGSWTEGEAAFDSASIDSPKKDRGPGRSKR